MKNSHRAVPTSFIVPRFVLPHPVLSQLTSQLRGLVLRPLVPCFLAAVLCSIGVGAQEKTAEPSHASGWVVIPVEEYRVLRAKAYPVEHDPEPPPLDATSPAWTTTCMWPAIWPRDEPHSPSMF